MLCTMRTILCCVPVLLTLSLCACIDPSDRRPGLWLSGEVVEDEVDDWSFSNDQPEIFIETRTPYVIAHSTTIACAADEGGLYVAARNPTGKRWVKNVERDPNVRIEIDGRLYERELRQIDDPAAIEAAYRAYASKYGWPDSPPSDAPEVRYFRVIPRG